MKIIITENQNYVLRRLQQFISIVEDQIEGYELNEENPWWCSAYYNPELFIDNIRDHSIEEFTSQNWNFFHGNSENGGSDMDLGFLYKIVENNYGNYIRNVWVSKCGYNR